MIRRILDVGFTEDGVAEELVVLRLAFFAKERAERTVGEPEQLPNGILNADILMRKHDKTRRAMVMPAECDEPSPIPMDTIDVTRCTTTDLDTIDDGRIADVWYGATNDMRLLSSDWVGETHF